LGDERSQIGVRLSSSSPQWFALDPHQLEDSPLGSPFFRGRAVRGAANSCREILYLLNNVAGPYHLVGRLPPNHDEIIIIALYVRAVSIAGHENMRCSASRSFSRQYKLDASRHNSGRNKAWCEWPNGYTVKLRFIAQVQGNILFASK
jgi:hypothetical protein